MKNISKINSVRKTTLGYNQSPTKLTIGAKTLRFKNSKELLLLIAQYLAKTYSDKTWLRVLIQQLPYIGSAIDTILTDTASKNWQQKVERFLYLLVHKLEKIEKEKINTQFIITDEFIALLRQAIEHSGKIYEEEKLEYFASIIENAALKENSEYYYKENFLKIVSEVSALHIAILKLIYDKQKDTPVGKEEEIKTPVSNNDLVGSEQFKNYSRYLLETRATELIRYGLLYDWSLGRYGYTPGKYAITQYARDFIKFITD